MWIIASRGTAINTGDADFYAWHTAEWAERWEGELRFRGGSNLRVKGRDAIALLDTLKMSWWVCPWADFAVNLDNASCWHWFEAMDEDLWGGTLYFSGGGSIDLRGKQAVSLTQYMRDCNRKICDQNLNEGLSRILNNTH